MYRIALHQAKYHIYWTWCGWVAYKLEFWDGIWSSPMRLAYLSPSRQSGNASELLNLKNPASLTFDPRKRMRESKESRNPDIPECKVLCFMAEEVHARAVSSFLTLVSSIPGDLLSGQLQKLWEKKTKTGWRGAALQPSWQSRTGQRAVGEGCRKKGRGGSKGAPEARVLSLTCIPQKYSHHLSWAETPGLCVRPLFLSLKTKTIFYGNWAQSCFFIAYFSTSQIC